jgi:hypothetical protein
MVKKKVGKWDEDRHRKWDVWLKIFAALVTVAGLSIGAYQYSKSRADQLKLQERSAAESQKAELRKRQEKQLELLTRLHVVTGKIAADLGDKEQVRKDIREFEAIYWGERAYIEEPGIVDELHNLYLDLMNLTEVRWVVKNGRHV